MEDTQDESTAIEVKNLSADIEHWTYNQTLNLCKIFINRTMIPALFEKGRQEGKSVEQIRKDLEDIVPYRTMMIYAPEWSKRKYKRYHNEKSASLQNARLVIEDESPKIPPPEEIVIEPESVQREQQKRVVKIEMGWNQCASFTIWFSKELKAHAEGKKGKYIIEYDPLTKEISVDVEED